MKIAPVGSLEFTVFTTDTNIATRRDDRGTRMDSDGTKIDWRQTFPAPDWNDPGDAVVWIDPAKFDAAWRETDQWVGPGGTPGGQDNRYAKVGAWIPDRSHHGQALR